MIGTSDVSRVFHTLVIAMSTNEDADMFEFIGNVYSNFIDVDFNL